METELIDNLSYEEINAISQRLLLLDLRQGKLNLDEYRKISRALNGFFGVMIVKHSIEKVDNLKNGRL